MDHRSINAVSICAALLMVFWDLSMDPLRATIEGRWVWQSPGVYLGIPMSNFLGWFLTAWLMFRAFGAWLLANRKRLPLRDEFAKWPFWAVGAMVYLSFCGEYLLNPMVDGRRRHRICRALGRRGAQRCRPHRAADHGSSRRLCGATDDRGAAPGAGAQRRLRQRARGRADPARPRYDRVTSMDTPRRTFMLESERRLRAAPEELTAIILDPEQLSYWGRAVFMECEVLDHGDSDGLGMETRSYAKGLLPHAFIVSLAHQRARSAQIDARRCLGRPRGLRQARGNT